MKKILLSFVVCFLSLSANLFSQSITVTSPNGGEQWVPGSSHNITWTSTGGITDINIFYSSNNGSSFSLVAAFLSNTGTYSWTVPSVTSNQCRVKVVDANNTNNLDISDTTFTIAVPSSLSLFKPNGGNVLTANSSYNMDWNSSGLSSVDIFFSSDSGSTWSNVVSGYGATSNPYTWTVPNIASSACLVYITGVDGLGNTISDTSDSFFTITIPSSITVTFPNGGVPLTVGTNQNITWTSSGISSNVIIKYSTNYGQTWNLIAGAALNNGSYSWTVPNTPQCSTLVRISDYSDTTIYDVSNSAFCINAASASLTLTSPNGGEDWIIGTPYNITWNTTGTINQVDLYYSTNGGSSWTLINDFIQNTGSYSWTIPNSPSVNCKVKVVDSNNPSTIYDESNAVFKISSGTQQSGSYFTITAPNGGEVWTAQTYHYIYWVDDSVSSYVTLEYSTNNGSTWNTIISGTYNNGYYQWYVANTPSTNCKVRITDYYNTSIKDTSDNVFTIAAAPQSITVSTPNNGEVWAEGTSQYIYWSSTNVDTVKIEYSTNNGSTWNNVVAATPGANGYYIWTVPSTPSNFCKVKISNVSNSSVYDISDNVFKIVLSSIVVSTPNGGENWVGNTYHYIYWSSSGLSSYVKIDYTIDNGANWTNIVNGSSNNGQYQWYVPNSPSTQCRVRVSDYYNNNLTDSSNALFTISAPTPSITVTTPNGGEQWVTSSAQYIYWNESNSNNVKVEYSTNNGFSWNTIVASTPAGNNAYYWNPLPSTPSAQCLVRVSDVNQPQYNDVSNNTFSLVNPYITVTEPNGGESWPQGTNHYMYWNYAGTSNYVTIEYSTNGGALWNTIVAGASNNGQYYWNVPPPNSSTCKVRISDYYDSTIVDQTDGLFSIDSAGSPTITVTTPNGGEQWNVASAQYIYWNSSNVDSVDIYYSTNNGSTWNLIASSIDAATTYYYWNPIPNAPSNNCRIKVQDYLNSSIYDASNNTFKIINPSFTITTPNGGEQWTGGDYNYIYWNSAGVSSYVIIDYSIDTGNTWTNITYGAYNYGYYNWSVPNTPSTHCLVSIRDYYTQSIGDTSNATFTIIAATPSITVTTPNNGENWLIGSSQYIYWQQQWADSVKIEYTTDNGATWNLITSSAPAGNGYYYWTAIPNTPSTQCKVKVTVTSDTSVFDVSDNVFTITQPYLLVTTPNGGETWVANTYKYIYYTGAISSQYVNLDYSTDSGNTWTAIIYGTYNNGQYQWYVPNTPSTTCLIKVSDYYDTTTQDMSDAVFTIGAPVPAITVSTPNGGEQWNAGSSQYIYWSSSYVTNVKLEYSTNNGANWTTIISSTPASNGYYQWPLPNISSSLCKVRISDASNSAVYDISDNVFSIIIPGVVVTSPNGGEQWQGGSGQYIYWTSAGLSSYVSIDYSIDNGATFTNIVNGTYNNGQYYWTLPNTPSDSCLVIVKDYYTPALTDTSDNLFSIISSNPTITVTSPNGGEQWGTGTGHYIYWNSSNVNNVMIEYSINNGSTWNTIVASTSAGNGSYYWTVPNSPSVNCLVRISDATNSSINDVSNSVFSIIIPTIVVNQPNGGEQWVAGTTQYITWTSNGASNYVTIYYSINGGSSWITVVNGASNNGSYAWTVPNNPSTNCKVQVSDYYNSSVFDISNNIFAILPPPPSVTLTSPNGGEVWATGTTQYISWNSTSINFVKLEYSLNGGSNWNVIISSTAASNGSYNWPVPNTPSANCLVRISDASNPGLNDVSNSFFSIVQPLITVIAPNGGEQWTGLTNQYITWTSSGISNYVVIEYSINNGASWSMVANGAYNNGQYYWTVPNTPSTNCRVRIKDYYNNIVSDISNNTFTILTAPASIVVNAPNGGENWGAGTSQYITWSSSGVTNVKIEYSINGGGSWNMVIASTPASNGNYYWPVPNSPSSNCLVKITDAANGSVFDQSNSVFSITNPTITVTSPNGGETWTAGTGYYIYWNSSGISNYVKIQYSTDNGSTWNNVATSAYNNGSYWWTVPNTPSNNCLVKVMDYYNNAVYDVSNSTFTIVSPPPAITVNTPNGGESWVTGNTYYIYWSSSGVGNVKLEYSTNGGSTWNVIIASMSNTGSYNWPVPNTPSTTCLVRVSDASNGSISDISNNTFTITSPFITVTSPNGGETLQATNGYYIQWTSAGVSAVKIEYSTDNGSTFNMIIASTTNYGYYYWSVPNTPSNVCKVKVTSTGLPSITDQSNNTFAITPPVPTLTLNSPNNGEYWYVGYQYYINWSSSAVANVKLEYSTNAGSTWNTIIATTSANSGFYYWPVPNTPSATCKIKISDASNLSLSDSSYGVFTIATPVPSITVNYPNGGENWTESTYQYISWSTNFVNSVNVEYSVDSGATWNMLVTNSSSNYYYWNIPGTPSNDCYVKVTSATNVSVYDTSNSVFTISAYVPNNNTIAVDSVHPVPFCKEDTFHVYFTGNGVFNAGNVYTAQLSDSSGNFFNPLAIGSVADTVTTDSIACVVPSWVYNGSGYRIRIVASDLPTTGSDNGSDISISSPEFDFAASEVIKYLPDGNVQFSYIGDTSNIASYAWTFGNGSTSSVSNPQYSYSQIGYYDVGLTATDSNGCVITQNKYSYMRIEQLLPNTQLSTNTTVDLTDVTFLDPVTGVMTMTDGNCIITLDSGLTWTISYTGLGTTATSVSMQPGYWFITGANGNIVYSIDSGLSWLPMYTGTLETFNSSWFSAPNFGFSVGTNGVIYYYDGTNWTAQSSNVSYNLSSVYTLGNIGYSVGYNGSIVYYDGSNWSVQTSPVTTNLNSVFFTDVNAGLAVGDNGYIVSYNGTSWNIALSGVDVNFSSVTAHGDSAWAVSNSGIIYWSDDAGTTWMRYSVGATTDLSGVTYIKSGGKAASSSKGYISGKGGDARAFFSDNSNDTTTTIHETVLAKNNFMIYPNPARHTLYLETFVNGTESFLIQLRNTNGQLVQTIADTDVSGAYRKQMDISQLASGVYFVHILQGDKFWVKKVVVTR